jgi:hypothetical protein
MRGLGDEIAVLEGLEGPIPSFFTTQDVIDASSGANFSGGSSFAPGLPLLPSNAGLAETYDFEGLEGSIPSFFTTQDVLDASSGANFSGGSSFAPGLPLLPSNAGLAESYDGIPLEASDGHYGSTMGLSAAPIPSFFTTQDVLDASSGANYSGGSSFAPGLPLLPSNAGLAELDLADLAASIPSFYTTQDVLDPSSGANYSGGSSFAPGLPLLPSNAGLAGLDGVLDSVFARRSPRLRNAGWMGLFKRAAGAQAVQDNKNKIQRLQRQLQRPLPPQERNRLLVALSSRMTGLNRQRVVRAGFWSGIHPRSTGGAVSSAWSGTTSRFAPRSPGRFAPRSTGGASPSGMFRNLTQRKY